MHDTLAVILGAGGGTAERTLRGVFGGLGLGLGLWLYALAFRRLSLRRKVADTPTARLRSVAMGPAEVSALAAPLGPSLPAPFSGGPCCWWRITVEQEEEVRTRNGTSRQWKEVHAEQSAAPFALEQDGVRLMVLPEGAEIRAPKLLELVVGGPSLGMLFGGGAPPALPGPAAVVWLAGGVLPQRRRLREWRIDERRPVFALGVVRPHGPPGEEGVPALGAGRAGEPFLITTESEGELLRELGLGVLARLAGGLALAGLGAWLLARAFL